MNKTNPAVVEDKRTYAERHGAELGLPPFTTEPSALSLDKDASRVAGKTFEALGHRPNDPDVRAAYEALKRETKAQYDHLISRGAKFTPWTREGQPYADSAAMAADVRDNRHLYYFPTDSGFGTDDRFNDHPLNEQVPGAVAGVKYNDLFRAVHDWFAHAMHGHQFGPQGELRAWHEHARMFSPLARKALTTETHGQNSWFNFGPHNPEAVHISKRVQADQKADILPESAYPKAKLARWFRTPDYKGTGGNTHAATRELVSPFAGKWFSTSAQQNDPYHKEGSFQFEFESDHLKPEHGDVVDARQNEALVGSSRPMYLHPALTGVKFKGHESHPDFQHVRGLVEDANVERQKHGLKPVAVTAKGAQPRRLARPKPSPEEQGFTSTIWKQWQAWRKHLADNERRGRMNTAEGAPPVMDDNARLPFADWLEERGDPRAVIVRQHTEGRPAGKAGMPRYLHPEGGDRPHAASDDPPPHSNGWDFNRDLIHPGRLVDYDIEARPNAPYIHRPTIVWRHAGVTTARRAAGPGRFREHPVMFRAPVTANQYHDYADTLPEAKRKQWKAYAEFMGWHDTRPKPGAPAKLARSSVKDIPPGYWIDDKGKEHFVGQTMMHEQYLTENGHFRNQEEAYNAGWHKVNVMPDAALAYGAKPMTSKQKETLGVIAIRHKAPEALHLTRGGDHKPTRIKLARMPATQMGLGGATRQVNSASQHSRVDLAKRILAEAGMTPARVRAVLAHTGKETTPAVAATVLKSVNPQHARYAAAWLGLTTGLKRVTVFIPGEGGDQLSVITSPHSAEHVSAYLRAAGIGDFSTESRGAGTRAFVVNPSADMNTVSRGLDASHTAVPGRADRIGPRESPGAGNGPAESRAAFRDAISRAERTAGLTA